MFVKMSNVEGITVLAGTGADKRKGPVLWK